MELPQTFGSERDKGQNSNAYSISAAHRNKCHEQSEWHTGSGGDPGDSKPRGGICDSATLWPYDVARSPIILKKKT